MKPYTYHGPRNLELEVIELEEENERLRRENLTLHEDNARLRSYLTAADRDIGQARLLAATREAYGGRAARQ